MIPKFPEFKNIEWNDQKSVLPFIREFPPYSDYNFVSLWSWDTRKKMRLSLLQDNLVVLFHDYLTETPFLSFIGKNNIAQTARVLIEHSQNRYNETALKLLPEYMVQHLPEADFVVADDIDAHDYIISTEYLSTLDSMPNSKNMAALSCKRFLKHYPACSFKISESTEVKNDCIGLFKNWAKAKNLEHWELNEYSAFERFIQNEENGNYILSMYDNGKMIAFTSYELLPDQYAICHFVKADHNYAGIYDALFHMLGKTLKAHGVIYWNFEQDLGLPGLRQSKRKYKPVFYLKKYTATLR